VHGITDEQLLKEPTFADIVDEFMEFFDGAKLVAHNAMFDLGFINAELDRLGKPEIAVERIVDTLALARRKHPMGPNSLDALCKRYGIDNSHRTLHGALLDSEILAEVYIELIGGKQTALGLSSSGSSGNDDRSGNGGNIVLRQRPAPWHRVSAIRSAQPMMPLLRKWATRQSGKNTLADIEKNPARAGFFFRSL
jgi:DNA polymerase-3 subunit epsilon